MTQKNRALRALLSTLGAVGVISFAFQANAQTSTSTVNTNMVGQTPTTSPTAVQTTAVSYVPTVTSGTMPFGGLPNFLSFRDLSVGSSGAEVYDLQSTLAEQGYFTFGLPTGYFGSITRSAVTSFQRANGLPQTGYFGPLTKTSLASLVSTLSSLITSSSGTNTNTGSSGGISTNGSSVSTSMLAPLRPTGYWYNGNWYNSAPPTGTTDIVGYWLNGTWTPIPNISSSVAQNTASQTGASTTATSTTNSTYGISQSNWRPY